MSAQTKKPTDLPVKVGVNLNLKSKPLPVVITVVIVAVILALVAFAVLIPRAESPATAGTPDSPATVVDPTAQITYPLDINTADADTLALLPGIGSVRAQAIVEYREANGAFTSIGDIRDVYGIGPALFERIKERIKV